jgi:hypothetical protein
MKPLVKEWIVGFLERHRARFAPNDWPDPDSKPEDWIEFVKGWVTAFALKQISEAEADEASRRLALDPPQWRRDHVPAVVKAVEALRGAKAGPPVASDDRAAAVAASRDCPGCSGSGYGSAVDAARTQATGHEVRVACLCPCACPMSRWVERQLAQSDAETLRRLKSAGPWAVAPDGDDFDARCLGRWRDMPETERETWLALVRERAPFLRATPLAQVFMAMAWAEDPGSVIAAAPPRRAADARGPRQAMGGPVADAAPRSVLVPTPVPEPEATTVAVAAPDPTIDPDEEF